MKYALAIVVVLSLGGAFFFTKEVEYTAPIMEVIEKEVTVEVETLEKRIEDALTASSTEIETEAQKAFEEKKLQMQKEIELEVTRAYRAEIEAREATLEAEVSL